MGTGIVAQLLHNLPYNGRWLYWLSVITFGLNVVLFSLAFLVSLLRYMLWPEIWSVMLKYPNQALFLAAVPIGLATIINMIALVCVPSWGPWTVQFCWALWILAAVLAVAIAFYLPFVLMSGPEETKFSSMTALWLFPVLAPIVVAGSSAVVADVLPNPQHALWTVLVGYSLWGIGVPLAMMILVIYFQRLALHKLPPREVMVSVFIPIGPFGQGGYGIMFLGKVAMKVFPKTHTVHELAGIILYNVGFITALIMWAFGLAWFFFAIATIYKSKHFPFNMGWWGFTFPIGVYAANSVLLGQELPSRFFRVLGTVCSNPPPPVSDDV